MIDWYKIQNGSDMRGVAMNGIPGEVINFTPEMAKGIGTAFSIWLSKTANKNTEHLKIAIGCDSRITGPDLKAGLIKGFSHNNVTSLDCGIASTPSMFMSTVFGTVNSDAGVMITASHLPFNRNGMKFFTKNGGLDKTQIKEVLDLATSLDLSSIGDGIAKVEPLNLISIYSDYLVDYVRSNVNDPDNYNHPLQGLKIIVDAGNGAGGFYADQVLEALGADTTGSQFLDPDGMFPNHIPNPEDKAAMESIQNATIQSNADLGIIFDTDVDRSAIVDSSGKIINRNRLIALMAAITLEENPGTTIVTDSVTSDGLGKFIESLGGKHHRFKRGYKNVINESIRLNEDNIHSALAIETSGHGAMKENYFLDDGAFTITKILVKMAQLNNKGQSIGDLISSLNEPSESKEYRIKILEDDFQTYGLKVIESLQSFTAEYDNFKVAPNNYEGIRLFSTDADLDGWFLVRLSLHDPILPINIESNIVGGEEKLKIILAKQLDQFSGLDITPLK